MSRYARGILLAKHKRSDAPCGQVCGFGGLGHTFVLSSVGQFRDVQSRVLWCALLFQGTSLGAGLSAMEVLHRTAETYRALRSYEIQVDVQTILGPNVSERHLTEAGLESGKYRVTEEGKPLRVADGKAQWEFDPAANEYRKSPISQPVRTSRTAFEQIDQHVKRAEIAREEQYTVNGKPVPVYVVRVMRNRWPVHDFADINLAMYRMDKKSFVVYKVIK